MQMSGGKRSSGEGNEARRAINYVFISLLAGPVQKRGGRIHGASCLRNARDEIRGKRFVFLFTRHLLRGRAREFRTILVKPARVGQLRARVCVRPCNLNDSTLRTSVSVGHERNSPWN